MPYTLTEIHNIYYSEFDTKKTTQKNIKLKKMCVYDDFFELFPSLTLKKPVFQQSKIKKFNLENSKYLLPFSYKLLFSRLTLALIAVYKPNLS